MNLNYLQNFQLQIKFDLVVCGHTLLELPSAEERLKTVLNLWRKTSGYLILVEHGSRAAFEVRIDLSGPKFLEIITNLFFSL